MAAEQRKRHYEPSLQPPTELTAPVISLLSSEDEEPAETESSAAKKKKSKASVGKSVNIADGSEVDGANVRYVSVVGPSYPTEVRIRIDGTPFPQPRTRIAPGPAKRLYDPAKKNEKMCRERLVKLLGREAPLFPGRVPLTVQVVFEMPRPAYHCRKNGDARDNAPGFCTAPPDIDNLAKYVLDCLNGVIFNDDSQVVSLSATMPYCKRATETGRTNVVVSVHGPRKSG